MKDNACADLTVLGYDVRTFFDEGYRGIDNVYWENPSGLSDDDARAEIGWVGANSFLWDCLAVLESWAQSKPIAGAEGATIVSIAIVLSSIPPYIELPQIGGGYLHLDVAEPRAVQNDWELLGYDVGDVFLSTVLFLPMEVPPLNNHGLFDDADAAREFSLLADKFSPGHAPFMVYAVHEVSNRGNSAAVNVSKDGAWRTR